MQAKVGAESINENSVNMVLANKMSMQNYQTVKGLTSNILELVDKHDSMKWYLDVDEGKAL